MAGSSLSAQILAAEGFARSLRETPVQRFHSIIIGTLRSGSFWDRRQTVSCSRVPINNLKCSKEDAS